MTRPGLFVAIVGPSGVGKDSLIRAVAERFVDEPRFVVVRRVITRASDAYEEHDTLDLAAFEAARGAGRFALTWGAHGLFYGIPVEVDASLAAGKIVVGNLSRGAVGEARRRWTEVFAVLVTAKPETLAARLAGRGREGAEDRRDRLNRSLRETFSFEPDAVIDNDGPLEAAADRLFALMLERAETPAMNTRYALYLAPPPESPLWRFGSRVLGRDASTGASLEGYAPEGFSPEAWRAIAAEPRRYGFHATLKAPFRLRDGQTLAELEAAIAALAAEVPAFDLGALRCSVLKAGEDLGFMALTPAVRSGELAALEARALRQLDAFRAPPSEAEIARRRPVRLSERQREYLAIWGYPYVLEEFRLHFTLTGAVARPEELAAKLAADYVRDVADPGFSVDALVLFEQGDGEAFRIRRRFALGGANL